MNRTIDCYCGSCNEKTVNPSKDEWEYVEDEPYCPDCIDYSCTEDGDVLCGTHDIPEIEWNEIQTGPPGTPNWCEGMSADGRQWIIENRGGWTIAREVTQ
jgi:hypothetical protein